MLINIQLIKINEAIYEEKIKNPSDLDLSEGYSLDEIS